jgi:hypothetical protein
MHPISVVIDTFAARTDVGAALAGGFDRVRRRFVEPLLGSNPGLRAWFELQPAHVIGEPGDSSWRRLESLVSSPDAAYCSVEVRGDSRSAGYFHFGVRLAHELVTGVPHTVTMHAHPTLFSRVPGYGLTGEVETLTKLLGVSARASTGYVACHRSLARDVEEQRGGDTTAAMERDLRTQLRGCYWGNLLSAGHLEALGGREHVLATCPVPVLDDLSREDHELVYAGLRETPCAEHGYALIALERYFEPLLVRPAEDDDDGREVALVLDTSLD